MTQQDYSNRTFPFTREELQWIRDRAKSMADVFGTDSSWSHAYMELAFDANYLDAMLARAEISMAAIQIDKPNGIEYSPIYKNHITDGYQVWNKECPQCHQPTMQVVRIGKVQCSNCG